MRTIDQATTNYVAAISLVPDRYKQGIVNADWKSKAGSTDAEKNYADGVSKAVANQSRMKGIAKVSNEQWKQAATDKGANNIANGMRAGQDKYRANFTPVFNAMVAAAKSLKPRTTDAMSNIDNRLKPVVAAAIAASKKA